jgi:hypothetical protein
VVVIVSRANRSRVSRPARVSTTSAMTTPVAGAHRCH